MPIRLIALAVTLGLVPVLALAQEDSARRATVCEVVANLQQYEGRLVEIDGVLRRDFHHASLVTDEACPESAIFIGRTAPEAEGVNEFDEAWMATRSCPQDGLRLLSAGASNDSTFAQGPQ